MKKLRLILLFIFIVIIVSTIISALQTPNNIFTQIGIDTWGHFISFFFLTWLLHSLCKIALINTSICLLFYGALSEVGQHYLGYRNGEFLDFIGDAAGILLFILLKWCWLMYGKSSYHQIKSRKRY